MRRHGQFYKHGIMQSKMTRDDLLFYKQGEFRDKLESFKTGLRDEIQRQDREYLLKANEEELCNYLTSRHTLEVPVLHDENKNAHPAQDVDIDVSGRFVYAIHDDEGPHYVKGISITIAIPFEGDGQIFHFRPSAYSMSGIRGMVVENEIHLKYQRLPQDMDAEKLKKEIDRDIKAIRDHLQTMARDAETHNNFIKLETKRLVTNRKERILKDEGLVGNLGIPIKRREQDAATYTVPIVRRKPVIERPKIQEKAIASEPILQELEYNHILELISKMALVMERSPKAFRDMEEESLRWQFLVPLNSHYEMAGGETFNYTGKTDILIRYEAKNVFIAECKIWHGAKALLETINQLLGYTSWRDTKTAVILFNKNENFSAVLSQIPDTVKKHPCFKREIGEGGETSFRYVFHQPNDKERELILTVSCFNIPQ